MFIERFIAFRYFFSSKNDGFISLISFLSFIGILLGVAALIITTSVMNGFREELTKQLIGIKGHVHVYPLSNNINFNEIVEKIEKHPFVNLALPIIEQPTIIEKDNSFHGILIQAHDPIKLQKHNYLKDKIIAGNILDLGLEDSVFIGKRMAEQLGLNMGDFITFIHSSSDETIFGAVSKERQLKVVGIFELGMKEYDRRFVFMGLENAKSFLEQDITHIEVFTNNNMHMALKLKNYLQNKDLDIVDWDHENSTVAKALNIEKNAMFIVLTLIILIAVLNIVSSLIMLVKNKTMDIAVLRAIGMRKKSILKIFLLNGMIIGVLGTFCGFLLGYLFVENIDSIRFFLENFLGTKLFDPEAYPINQLPALMDMKEVILICLLSLSSAFFATLYPAFRASKLNPSKILR